MFCLLIQNGNKNEGIRMKKLFIYLIDGGNVNEMHRFHTNKELSLGLLFQWGVLGIKGGQWGVEN